MLKSSLKLKVLPESQLLLWQELVSTPAHFILYGGTAIALQIGHRESIDFDFFTHQCFEPEELFESIDYLAGSEITHIDKNTLTCSVHREGGFVQCSYFGGLSMEHVAPPIELSSGIRIAALVDLLATKCATVQKRAEWKDYTDVVAILENTDLSLAQGIGAACAVYGKRFLPLSSLKALSYTKDLDPQLNPQQAQVLSHAIVETELDNFHAYQSIGPVGTSGAIGKPSTGRTPL